LQAFKRLTTQHRNCIKSFRKDHNNIPFINIAYDGQDSVSLDTRLQAFVFQVKEFANEGSRNTGSLIKSPSFVKQV
jgi:hypothetical protein